MIGDINTQIGRTTDTVKYVEASPLHASRCLLFAPGRIGTSSPELGVPVSFANICNLSGIFEVGYSGAGYSPELSYGSHMFQDLVEAGIFYGAIFENAKTLRFTLDALDGLENLATEPDDPDLQGIVRLVDVRGLGMTLYHNMLGNETLLGVLPDSE